MTADSIKGTQIPPLLEEMISEAIAREMRRGKEERWVLEFLTSHDGMRLPDGVDILIEELRGSDAAIRGPRCSVCGGHASQGSPAVCQRCGKWLCERCESDVCMDCKSASEVSPITHFAETIWTALGIFGIWSPQMGFLYLLTKDSLAAFYFVASIIALSASIVHNRGLPWVSIFREAARRRC